jgi:hypothetical protein
MKILADFFSGKRGMRRVPMGIFKSQNLRRGVSYRDTDARERRTVHGQAALV